MSGLYAVYDSTVLIGFAKEQFRFAPATAAWRPQVGGFPPATRGQPCHDALAAAGLLAAGRLPGAVAVATRSVRDAVARIVAAGPRPHAAEAADLFGAAFVKTLGVASSGGCIAADLLDNGSESDEASAQAAKLSDAAVVVTTRPQRYRHPVTLTPKEWVAVVVQALRF